MRDVEHHQRIARQAANASVLTMGTLGLAKFQRRL
jgi:hypothetical protein